ncbi:outer membrane beta-barrel protein [Vibrio natriegens]|uniref:OmpA family protein n=1 Tax=Vibrio natriegens TaxID=691 RepID=UPI001EFD95D7|nr:outer membrane beta-barrel protein [Vibrio natriegens]MCG9702268.1 outer membrane beta-barrel protein [Vibrio natriegens]
MLNKTLLTLCSILSVSSSCAEELGSVYFGGNVGGALIDITSSPALKEDDNPISLTAGVVGGVSLSHYLALETDVSYLGKTENESLWAWSNYALMHYPLSDKADGYVKAGMSTTQSQWSPSAGVGLYYRLSQGWWLDLGYRWIADVSDGDLYEFVIGARYQPPVVIPDPSNPLEMAKPSLVEQPNIMALLEHNRSGRYLFEADSAQLSPTPELRALAQTLLLHTEGRIHIIGHVVEGEDHQPSLSEQRAQAVAGFLIERGIPAERLVVTGTGGVSDQDYGAEYGRRVDIEFYPESQQP